MADTITSTPVTLPPEPAREYPIVRWPVIRITYPDPNGELALAARFVHTRRLDGGGLEDAPGDQGTPLVVEGLYGLALSRAAAGKPLLAQAYSLVQAALEEIARERGHI